MQFTTKHSCYCTGVAANHNSWKGSLRGAQHTDAMAAALSSTAAGAAGTAAAVGAGVAAAAAAGADVAAAGAAAAAGVAGAAAGAFFGLVIMITMKAPSGMLMEATVALSSSRTLPWKISFCAAAGISALLASIALFTVAICAQ
jgi:hypothetical protein